MAGARKTRTRRYLRQAPSHARCSTTRRSSRRFGCASPRTRSDTRPGTRRCLCSGAREPHAPWGCAWRRRTIWGNSSPVPRHDQRRLSRRSSMAPQKERSAAGQPGRARSHAGDQSPGPHCRSESPAERLGHPEASHRPNQASAPSNWRSVRGEGSRGQVFRSAAQRSWELRDDVRCSGRGRLVRLCPCQGSVEHCVLCLFDRRVRELNRERSIVLSLLGDLLGSIRVVLGPLGIDVVANLRDVLVP